jgi:hypothetical protein
LVVLLQTFNFGILISERKLYAMKKLLLFALFITIKLQLFAQAITVTYPDGGEVFTANSVEFIIWTDQTAHRQRSVGARRAGDARGRARAGQRR